MPPASGWRTEDRPLGHGGGTMRVYLSFDIEVWCEGWQELDAQFPASFQRYVYGRSAAGDYALPKTLELLKRHGLHGVFFVEPLFAARFGLQHLREIVQLIQGAGQEVQLHIHPEWTDELPAPPIAEASRKRQHLCYYSEDEQRALIHHAAQLLQQAGAPAPTAFRAGSYAADAATYRALSALGLRIDSSLNSCYAVSGADIAWARNSNERLELEGVCSYPVTVVRDGLGRPRPAQINSLGFAEMRQALERAHAAGQQDFVIVSHNFEMLRPGSSTPDWTVVRRFERLCAYLAAERGRYEVGGFAHRPPRSAPHPELPRLPAHATLARLGEQLRRRFTDRLASGQPS